MDNELPIVAGRTLSRSLNDLERSALTCLAKEQEKLSPDNALIAVLCDTVRLCREYGDGVKAACRSGKSRNSPFAH